MTTSPQPPAGSPGPARPAAAGQAEAASPGAGGGAPRQGAPQPGTISFEVFFDTNPGKARDHNEDTIWAATPTHAASAVRGYLFVVADGMGGHNAGEVASQGAVRGVYERFYADTEPDIRRSMDNAIRRTNNELFTQAQANPAQHGMGTTMTAAVLKGNKLHISHVGDSRLYLIRGGQIEQVTHDHSWVEEQVRAGVLSRVQAENHPQRNVITRALATGPDVKVDYEERELQPGDIIVMCSDGLNTEVGDQQISSHATKALNAQEAVQRLIQLANDNGGEDNISVAVIRIGAPVAGTGPIPTLVGANAQKKGGFPLLPVVGALAAVIVVGAILAVFVLPRLNLGQATTKPPAATTDVKASTEMAPTATLRPGAETTAPSNKVAALSGTAAVVATETAQAALLPAQTATAEPGVATSTAAPTGTATTVPTATSTVRPRNTATRTSTVAATPVPQWFQNNIMPVLKSPDNSSESDPVTFRWEAGGHALKDSEGYALLVWREDDQNLKGKTGLALGVPYDACGEKYKQTTRQVPLASLKGPGWYNWSVVVIDTANGRCDVVSNQPGPYRVEIVASGGPAPAPTSCTGTGCNKPGSGG